MSDKDMSFTEFQEYMADGDKAAEHVITLMLGIHPTRGNQALNRLHELDVRGEKLWKLFKGTCHRDVWELYEWVEQEKGKGVGQSDPLL